MKTVKFLTLLALLISTSGVRTAFAQVERVEMRVDGLACPFCAYGLEKKLKDVKGVGKVTIYVDKGVAILTSKKDLSIDIERLEPVARDAGFTPGPISLTVTGAISEKNGAPVFLISGTDLQFMLKSNAQLEKLRAESIPQGGTVKVTGSLTKETPQGHHSHPYTLAVEKVEATR